MRKEIIGDCELYLADCIDVLADPSLSKFNTIVTDPPYGIGERSGTIGQSRAHKNEYGAYEDTYENLVNQIIPRFAEALSMCGRAVVTPGGIGVWDYPKPDILGGFYQPAATGMCLWGRITYQPILFYGRDPMIGKTIENITYVLTEKPSEIQHPCAKPLNATKWLVKRASAHGETVLDPFAGSGTTGVACVKLGRKFIGIELDERYFDIACRRIEEAYKQPDMFIEPAKKVEQETLI